jgi:GTP cyclohydrolase-4
MVRPDATAMRHVIYLGLGSNLGDRQLSLAQALGRLRQVFDVEAASPAYETEPVGVIDQPRFINLVIRATTDLPPERVLADLKRIERELGRRAEKEMRNGPRPIDIDLLLYDDLVTVGAVQLADDGPGSRGAGVGPPDDIRDSRGTGAGPPGDGVQRPLRIPHPQLCERAFVLVPMADIAPDLVHPVLNESMAVLRDRVGSAGVARLTGGLLAGFARDIQEEPPRHAIGLERVGVTGIERVIRLATGHPVELFYAQLDLFVDLRSDRKGVHMSRFPHLVDQTLDDLVRREAPDIESLAGRVAEDLVGRQGADRAEVRVRAKVPRTRYTPISAQRTQDLFTLLAWAVSDGQRQARLVGVEVAGMTACPCAQEMSRDHARERLREVGFDEEQVDRALSVVPLATHTQRSWGTLIVSDHPAVSADDLVRIVEASMSSEIYELLKRPDEFFVVNRAHQNPKFVEDVVRDMLGHIADVYPVLPDDAFVLARQLNNESIHRHDVYAERGTTLGDLRLELAGGEPGRFVSLESWLASALD